MKKPVYVRQLPMHEIKSINKSIRQAMEADGYTDDEIYEALKIAYDSKISDLKN